MRYNSNALRVWLTWSPIENAYTQYRWFNMMEMFIIVSTVWYIKYPINFITMGVYLYNLTAPIFFHRNNAKAFQKMYKITTFLTIGLLIYNIISYVQS
jgi:hypothetical protein